MDEFIDTTQFSSLHVPIHEGL